MKIPRVQVLGPLVGLALTPHLFDEGLIVRVDDSGRKLVSLRNEPASKP